MKRLTQILLVAAILLSAPVLFHLITAAENRPVLPKSGPPPVGPYTPGIDAGDYLYVSGQGARRANGTMPSTFDEHVQQAIENVKAVVEGGGLTMDHIVYTHVYTTDIERFADINRVYSKYFPKAPPARATLGVAKLPSNNVVEINAVAVRNLSNKRPVIVPGHNPGEPASAGILTHDRLFISGMRGRELSTGRVPESPAAQVELALDGMKAVCEAAGLSMAHVAFVNPYLTGKIPANVMNKLYAQRFEFGNTPGRATIHVASLPEGAQIEFTGVAVRDLRQRKAVRPKNMRPSATASPCVFAGDTLYCSAKSGFIPGPNGGIFAATVEHQLRQTMRNLLDNLEEADMDFSHVVSTNVYLDDMRDFEAMNQGYAQYFPGVPPTRTTVQQLDATERKRDGGDRYPTLEQISLIAIRPAAKK